MVVTNELAGDHRAEDVVRALSDRHQRRVAVKPLDLVFGGVAVSTVDPHGLERGGDADLGRVELGHPGLEIGAPAGVESRGRPPGEQPRRLHLGRHVRQLQLDRLEVRDRAAESMALACVGERAVEACLRHTHGPAGDVDATELERRQRLLQPLTLLPAQHVLDRHATVAQEHFRRLRSLVAQLVEILADREARRPLFDHQHGHAPMAWLRVGIGLDQHRKRVGVARVGDPGLGAVDNVVVTLALRHCGDAL